MGNEAATLESRKSALRDRLSSGRKALDVFDKLRENELVAAASPLKDFDLIMKRIKVSLPGVVYGEAADGVSISSVPYPQQSREIV